MTDEDDATWDTAHPGLTWDEAGIPANETHRRDPPTLPHRSRWRLTHHRGNGCLWIRVRVPKGKAQAPWAPSPVR